MAAVAQAQSMTTDPAEARIINAMFSQWGIAAQMNWNISEEICSGTALDYSKFYDNPELECNCSYTTCHITHLRVVSKDVVGPIPEGLWNLSCLIYIDLAQNYLTGPLSPSIGNLNRLKYLSLGSNALSRQVPPELGQE
ncbi:hypothetical protein L1887_25622 [Cichorium endivia]|nr:hypothetical protein L1887_25622 [Cichorium endivia]